MATNTDLSPLYLFLRSTLKDHIKNKSYDMEDLKNKIWMKDLITAGLTLKIKLEVIKTTCISTNKGHVVHFLQLIKIKQVLA